jgi:hypothetical protein
VVLLVLSSLFLALSGASALAQEVLAGSVYNATQEAEAVQRARQRIYPGGRDEGELAVQVQMTAPTRKIVPQAVEATPEEHDE